MIQSSKKKTTLYQQLTIAITITILLICSSLPLNAEKDNKEALAGKITTVIDKKKANKKGDLILINLGVKKRGKYR